MADADDPWGHLTHENRVRLTLVLRGHVNEVFTANRVIEQRTGYSSKIARNMMVDVLAHLATLAAETSLTAEQQASQLAKIEEHLARAIVEHPEEVIRDRIADVKKRWLVYEREAFPFREDGSLGGVPLHKDLEHQRTRIDELLESARSRKPKEATWDETLTSAAEMTEAADLTRDLEAKLEQCIGKAMQVKADRKRDRANGIRWAVGLAIAIALAVGGYFAGKGHGSGEVVRETRTVVVAPAAVPHRTGHQSTTP